MTFEEIVEEVMARCHLFSDEAETRIGRAVNRIYRSVTTSTGINTTRNVLGQAATCAIGQSTLTFTNVEKIHRVYDTSSGKPINLSQVSIYQIRELVPGTTSPKRWAILTTGATSVTIQVDVVAGSEFTLYADGTSSVSTLSGVTVPALPESFHDILVEGVLVEEYKKVDKIALSRESKMIYEQRLSDLKYFLSKSAYLDVYQGALAPSGRHTTGGGGGAGGGNSSGISYGADFNAPDTSLTLAGRYNVKDYGAVGNGTTDDSSAFQTVANLLEAGGGVMYVPAGTYLLNTAITFAPTTGSDNDRDIAIVLHNDATIQVSTTGSGFIFDGSTKRIGTGHTAGRTGIFGGRIWAGAVDVYTTGTILQFTNTDGATVKDVEIRGGTIGIEFNGCWSGLVRDCFMAHNKTGVHVTGTSIDIKILRNGIYDAINNGVYIGTGTNHYCQIIGNYLETITGNTINHEGNTSHELLIEGNFFNDNGGAGTVEIITKGAGTRIIGNSFTVPKVGATIAINLHADSGGAVVMGNICRGGTNYATSFIYDNDGSAQIIGNYHDGSGTAYTQATVGSYLYGNRGLGPDIVSGQFKFPATQNASTNANTLDDYEEGTWTPVIGGSGGTSGQAYSTQVGSYIKIGKLVTVSFVAVLSTEGTITGNVQIQGLPFTVANVTDRAIGAVQWASLATNWINVIAVAIPNSTTAEIRGATAAADNNATNLAAADINNTTQLWGTLTYVASA